MSVHPWEAVARRAWDAVSNSDVEGTRKGRSLKAGFVILFRIEADCIAEIWSVPRDQFTVDEFWA